MNADTCRFYNTEVVAANNTMNVHEEIQDTSCVLTGVLGVWILCREMQGLYLCIYV